MPPCSARLANGYIVPARPERRLLVSEGGSAGGGGGVGGHGAVALIHAESGAGATIGAAGLGDAVCAALQLLRAGQREGAAARLWGVSAPLCSTVAA